MYSVFNRVKISYEIEIQTFGKDEDEAKKKALEVAMDEAKFNADEGAITSPTAEVISTHPVEIPPGDLSIISEAASRLRRVGNEIVLSDEEIRVLKPLGLLLPPDYSLRAQRQGIDGKLRLSVHVEEIMEILEALNE